MGTTLRKLLLNLKRSNTLAYFATTSAMMEICFMKLLPEVLSGKSVSTATDVYGLALIFWEMVTAERPFEGKTVLEVRFVQSVKAPRHSVERH